MWLNYQQLQYFREIARQGSIIGASKVLLISSPALSMQLKSLEELLGQPLFLRAKRKLLITDFGKYVLEYAEKIFSTGEELLSNINNDFITTNISIGINSGIPKIITNKIIKYILNKYPKFRILITEGDDTKLSTDLLSRSCDLIVSNSYINDIHSLLVTKLVYESKLSLYGTQKYKKYQRNFPLSLDRVPLILPTLHSNLRQIIDEWYLSNKIHYKSLVEIHDVASKKILAQEGVGVVVLSEIGAKRLMVDKNIIKIGDMDTSESFYCTYRKGEYSLNKVIEDIYKNFKKIMNKK